MNLAELVRTAFEHSHMSGAPGSQSSRMRIRVPLMEVTPLATPNTAQLPPSTTPCDRQPKIRIEFDDKKLVEAVSRSPWAMEELTGSCCKARCAGGSGAAALRRFGFYVDVPAFKISPCSTRMWYHEMKNQI